MKRPDETRQDECLMMETSYDITAEVKAAMRKFPLWPVDPLHAVAIIGEEFGELQKAVVDNRFFDKATVDDMINEATQTAAMCVRFIMRLQEEML